MASPAAGGLELAAAARSDGAGSDGAGGKEAGGKKGSGAGWLVQGGAEVVRLGVRLVLGAAPRGRPQHRIRRIVARTAHCLERKISATRSAGSAGLRWPSRPI